MNTGSLVDEATRYLETVDLIRSLELDVMWLAEAEELRLARTGRLRSDSSCYCANPRVLINGRHVCFRLS